MKLDEGDYILGMWFLERRDQNFQYIVKRDKEGNWVGEYRFRYFEQDGKSNIFNGKDNKKFFSISYPKKWPDHSDEDMLKISQEIIDELERIYDPVFYDYMEIKGGIAKFMEEAKKKEWMHISTTQTVDTDTTH